MFTSIKDKILNVKKNVTLFNLSGNNESKDCVQSATSSSVATKQPINLNAGCEILTYCQNQWEIIHATNENNVRQADNVAKDIEAITGQIDRDKENLGLMTHLLLNSNLRTNITNCTKQVEQLYDTFKAVEESLVGLEDLIETIEFEKKKQEHRYHLQQYKLRKEEALKVYEDNLKENYAKCVEEHELKKKKELEERQQVFQEAFKTDLEIFKSFGTIPKLDIPKKQPSALLEEIQVDYDENELDQFFNESPSEQVP